jgi:hypothetical protein
VVIKVGDDEGFGVVVGGWTLTSKAMMTNDWAVVM